MNSQSVNLAQRLSGEAHRRIRDALDEADLIVLRVISFMQTQYNAEHGLLPSELRMMDRAATEADSKKLDSLFAGRTFVSFEDYCARGSRAVQLSEARLQAVRMVMKVIASEFGQVGTGIECWKAIPMELDAVARTYKLAEFWRQVVWGELKKKPGFAGITKPAANKSLAKPGLVAREWEIDGDKLRKLREEHDFSRGKFCLNIKLSVDSLDRIEKGVTVKQSTALKTIKRCKSLGWIATDTDLKK